MGDPSSRRQLMRERIIFRANQLHKAGLDSRVRFLKHAFGQDVPNGSTARKGDGIPVPDWREGRKVDGVTLSQVIRFNIFNASKGLVAVSLKGPKMGLDKGAMDALRPERDDAPHRLPLLAEAMLVSRTFSVTVEKCKTQWTGDLRVNRMHREFSIGIRCLGGYYRGPNHTIMRWDAVNGPNLAHELEHARHSNLAFMTRSHLVGLPSRRMEYLSTLAEITEASSLPLRPGDWVDLLGRGRVHHALAELRFFARFRLAHRIGLSEFSEALKTNVGKTNGAFEKIRSCAMKEYTREYRMLFGLPLEDIREVVHGLPLI